MKLYKIPFICSLWMLWGVQMSFSQTLVAQYAVGNIGSTACFITGNHASGGFGMVIRGFLDNNPDGPDVHPKYEVEDKYSVSGTLKEYSDGTAVLNVSLVNLDNNLTTFGMTLNFSGRTTSPPQVHTGCFNPSGANKFYTSATGSISGQDQTGAPVSATVSNAGNTIQIGQRNFYCNDANCEELAAWFAFSNITGPAGPPAVVDAYMKLTAIPLPVGSLQINKAVNNKPAGYSSPSFSMVVDCSDDSFDQTVQVTDGGSQTISNIPEGTTCTVTEPTLPSPPTGYVYDPPNISPAAPYTIVAGSTVGVNVTNSLRFVCGINIPVVTTTCINVGNDGNSSNDTFTYVISATGSNTGANYKVTKTAPGAATTEFASVSYGATSIASVAYPISGGNLTLAIDDNTVAACSRSNITVVPPPTCSPISDLELTKVADKAQVRTGDKLTYTLIILNKGPDTAKSVKVRDLVPFGLTFVSAAPTQGTYNSGTGIWAIGDIPNGSIHKLTIVTTVN